MIRWVVKIILWIAIYFIFVPKAQAKGRSGCLWFIIGMCSFVVPLVGSVVVGLALAQELGEPGVADLSVLAGLIVAVFLTAAMAVMLRYLPSKARAVRTRSYRPRSREDRDASAADKGGEHESVETERPS